MTTLLGTLAARSVRRAAGTLAVLVLAGALLAGCSGDDRAGQTANDPNPTSEATPAAERSPCPPPTEVPEGLSSETPFGNMQQDCTVVRAEAPGWSEEVACEVMWQAGEVLPAGYLGCAAPEGVDPLVLAQDCADAGLQGAWVYDNLAARDGEVIHEATFAINGDDVDC